MVITAEHGISLVNVLPLQPDDIPALWQHIKHSLQNALDKSKWSERYPIESLYSDLISGENKCWIISDAQTIKGIAITQDLQYPLGKSVMVFLLAGKEMHQWYENLHESLVNYAKLNGMKWIDACAREGMGKKYLHEIGYKNNANHYVLEVKNG